MTTKVCSVCGFEKHKSHFQGRRSQCKPCRKQIQIIDRQNFFERLYPDAPKEGVYCIYDELKELVYVGESNNIPRRLAEHIGGYDKSKSFHKGRLENCFVKEHYTYKIFETKTLKERLMKELELEFEYKPKYNKRWRNN